MNECMDLKIFTWKSQYWGKTINKNRITKNKRSGMDLRIGNYKYMSIRKTTENRITLKHIGMQIYI